MKTYTTREACALLGVDNKTFNRWLKKASITLQAGRYDEREKRITQVDLEQLATQHERTLGEGPVEREEHPTVKALERKVAAQSKQLAQLKADLETQVTESTKRLESVTLRYEELIGVLESHITEQGELLAQLNAVFHAFMMKTEQQLHDLREVELPNARAERKAMQDRIDALEARIEQLTATRATRTTPRQVARPTERPNEALVPNAEGLVPATQFAERHRVNKDAAKTAFKRQTIRTTKLMPSGSHYLNAEQQRGAVQYWRLHNTPGFHQCDDPACPCHEQQP